MNLTQRQIEFKNSYVKKESLRKRKSADTTAFCFNGNCGYAGDTRDPHSHFDASIPPIDRCNLSLGLKMDSMRLIWFCSTCATALKEQQERSSEIF